MPISNHSEAQIQKAICDYLRLRRIPFTVTDAARVWNKRGELRRSKVAKGWPDITAILPGGRALLIECKTSKGRVRPEQQAWIDSLREQGALVIVGRSLDVVMAVVDPELQKLSHKNFKEGKGR